MEDKLAVALGAIPMITALLLLLKGVSFLSALWAGWHAHALVKSGEAIQRAADKTEVLDVVQAERQADIDAPKGDALIEALQKGEA